MANWPNGVTELTTKAQIKFIFVSDSQGCIKKLKASNLYGRDGKSGVSGTCGPYGAQGDTGLDSNWKDTTKDLGEKYVGEVFISVLSTPPLNCIACDQSTVLRSTVLGTELVNAGCPYGVGDGSTTVNIPYSPPETGQFHAYIYKGVDV